MHVCVTGAKAPSASPLSMSKPEHPLQTGSAAAAGRGSGCHMGRRAASRKLAFRARSTFGIGGELAWEGQRHQAFKVPG